MPQLASCIYGNKKHSNFFGFTIVELLVVIVVIGILAAITIVSYTGLTQKAVASSLQSDLTNASKILKAYNVIYGYYPNLDSDYCPESPSDIDDNYCLKDSYGEDEFTYSADNNFSMQTFSLYATSGSTTYHITHDSNPIEFTPVVASGGTESDTSDGKYHVHAFTSSETFTLTGGSNVEVLVVAGGGSGGTSVLGSGGGGGGGAGGLIYNLSFAVFPQTYTVTVGAGGASQTAAETRGNSGENSVLDSLIAIGGGGGGKVWGDPGAVGGSGGGAGYHGYLYLAGASGTTSQGNKGGDTLNNNNGGGGGGAGGVGGNTFDCRPSTCVTWQGGLGGPGLTLSISGTPVMYAKGGQGGIPPNGFANGAANTGNGGSGVYAAGGSSGAGGSGVVIIRYKK